MGYAKQGGGGMTLFEKIIQVQAMFPELCKPSIKDEDQIASLTAEVERLRGLLLEVSTYFHGAIKANILKALQPKEGEG